MSHDEHQEETRWMGPDEPPQIVLIIPILMGLTLIMTVIGMVSLFS